LPAYPIPDARSTGNDLEVDVIPNRHPNVNKRMKDHVHVLGPDTKTPMPMIFPVVTSQQLFIFPVLGKDPLMCQLAKDWLIDGLSIVGIGSKTTTGYGVFKHLPQSPELEKWHQSYVYETLHPDPTLITQFQHLKDEELRYKIKEFEFDTRSWNPAYDDLYKYTLLHFCTEVKPELYEQEKSNPKSKIVKAIDNLTSYFAKS
jgi:hypothetical protein